MRFERITRRIAVALAAVGLAAGASACTSTEKRPEKPPSMRVDVAMTARNLCYAGASPRISIDPVPSGTAFFRVRFQNVGAIFTSPADYQVMADGQQIAEGAIDGYRGLCPGERQIFHLRIDVLAVDANGYALAFGQTQTRITSPSAMPKLRDDDSLFTPGPLLPATR